MSIPDPVHDSWLAWVPWCPPPWVGVLPPSWNLDRHDPRTPQTQDWRQQDRRPQDQLMTVPQLAAYLQVGNLWVYRRLKDGYIPHTRIGGLYRFSRQAIDAWLWH